MIKSAYSLKTLPFSGIITSAMRTSAQKEHHQMTKESDTTEKKYEDSFLKMIVFTSPVMPQSLYDMLLCAIRIVDLPVHNDIVDLFLIFGDASIIPESDSPIYADFVTRLQLAIRMFLNAFAAQHHIHCPSHKLIQIEKNNPNGRIFPVFEEFKPNLGKCITRGKESKKTKTFREEPVSKTLAVTGDTVAPIHLYKNYLTYALYSYREDPNYSYDHARIEADTIVDDSIHILRLIQKAFQLLSEVICIYIQMFPTETQGPNLVNRSGHMFVAFTQRNREDALRKFAEFEELQFISTSNKAVSKPFDIIDTDSANYVGGLPKNCLISQLNAFLGLLYSIGFMSTIAFSVRVTKDAPHPQTGKVACKIYNSAELPISKLFNAKGLQHLITLCTEFITEANKPKPQSKESDSDSDSTEDPDDSDDGDSDEESKQPIFDFKDAFVKIGVIRYACIVSYSQDGLKQAISDIRKDALKYADIYCDKNIFAINISTTTLNHPELKDMIAMSSQNHLKPKQYQDLIVFRLPDLKSYYSLHAVQQENSNKAKQNLESIIMSRIQDLIPEEYSDSEQLYTDAETQTDPLSPQIAQEEEKTATNNDQNPQEVPNIMPTDIQTIVTTPIITPIVSHKYLCSCNMHWERKCPSLVSHMGSQPSHQMRKYVNGSYIPY